MCEKLDPIILQLGSIAWPLVAVGVAVYFRASIAKLLDACVSRLARGDQVKLGPIEFGSAVGKLLVPEPSGLITDDHLALAHRSWRVPDRDTEFHAQMYQFHVIVVGDDFTLNQVEYVIYRLDRSYPRPVQTGGTRDRLFELKELANGTSLLRAEVYICGQKQPVRLSRYIDLSETSEPLKVRYFKP